MKSDINQQLVHSYLQVNGRPLDSALYDFYLDGGSTQNVLDELKKYQNPDGGFGKGIEPDFQLPASSALATSVTFQYLSKLGTLEGNELAQRGIAYFLQIYNPEKSGWDIVPKEVNNYPHAPWWDYETAMTGFGWGNPSAEILGYLLQYRALAKDVSLLKSLTGRALERLHELTTIDKPDFHELLCYARLYRQADESLQAQLYEPLASLITKVVSVNPNEWKSYDAAPLTFVKSSDSPFIGLFDKAIIKANLDYLQQTIVDASHWEPNWNWGGNYPEAWKQAKREWRGKITVENLMILGAFGELQTPMNGMTTTIQPVARFLDNNGLVKQWPKKQTDKRLVLEYLATKFDFGVSYHEREVNEILKEWHTFNDWPLLRRELFEQGFLSRDRSGIDYRRLV